MEPTEKSSLVPPNTNTINTHETEVTHIFARFKNQFVHTWTLTNDEVWKNFAESFFELTKNLYRVYSNQGNAPLFMETLACAYGELKKVRPWLAQQIITRKEGVTQLMHSAAMRYEYTKK
jgi:hypothetical protein